MRSAFVAAAALGTLAGLHAGEAAAQQTVRELMDGGGRMASPAELRGLLGIAPGPAAGVAATGPRVDEAGRGCVDGDCRYYWRTADGRWFVSGSPDTAAPVSPRRAP
ncbi:MAG: hypothetical protein RJA99_3075 [Pseudomonadota bacterium]|jgi:hypothetical protein